jgi:hypothetical protein
VRKWRRTSWQQLIAQADFLEYERQRLCPGDRQNGIAATVVRDETIEGDVAGYHY